jgi:hypothetical protein
MRYDISYCAIARVHRGVAVLLRVPRVQVAQPIEQQAAALARDAGGIVQVQHRVLAAAELDPLVLGRQESTPPQPRVERLVHLPRRDEDDERGQVLVVAAEPVVHPRAHARTPRDLRARLQERDRGIVVDRLRVHRPDNTEVVDDAGGVREEVGDPRAVLPVLAEAEDRSRERDGRLVPRHARQPLPLAHRVGQLLAVARVQHRLVVERLDLRGATRHEEVNDPLRPGGMVQLSAQHTTASRGVGLTRREQRGGVDEARERDTTEPQPEAAQQRAAGQAVGGNGTYALGHLTLRFGN